MIEFTQVNAGYDGKTVIHDITLSVEQGEVLALIGPNGSGKTTFIRAASGVIPLRSGWIKVNGKLLSEISPAERARAIAVVPQNRSLPPAFTAVEVVALGRTPHLNWLGKISEHDQQIIDEVLAQMNLTDLMDRNVGELSGGEQQRLFLARALVQEAPILLLDEPTTHLDLQYHINLMERIHALAHPLDAQTSNGQLKHAIIIAIHDLNLLSQYADRVGLMVDGRLKLLGTPAEVLRSEVLSEAYQIPLKVFKDKESGLSVIIPEKRSGYQ